MEEKNNIFYISISEI